MKIEPDTVFACVRVPRLPITIYENLCLSGNNFEKVLHQREYKTFRSILKNENPDLFILSQKDVIPDKVKVTLLNYLMRACSRFSPYKDFASSVELELSSESNFLEGEMQFIDKKKKVDIEKKIVKNNLHWKLGDQYLQLTSVEPIRFSEKGLLDSKNSLVHQEQIEYNPFDLKQNEERTNYSLELEQRKISQRDLNRLFKDLMPLRFINGNHVNKSIFWIDSIRDEIFRYRGSLPMGLTEAITGFPSFFKSFSELADESQSVLHPIRKTIYQKILGESEEVLLSEGDIKNWSKLAPKQWTNLSKDFSVICTPTDQGTFIEYFRSSFKGIRPFSEELLRSGKDLVDGSDNVIYFDLICQGKASVYNNRPQTTRYGLSIDGMKVPECLIPLDINDIKLYASPNELVLFSEQLKKRLVPVLTTTYLAENDRSVIYRFLAALGKSYLNDGFHADLNWVMQESIPRLKYKNFILFPRTWNIKKEDIQRKWHLLPGKFRLVEGEKKSLIFKKSPWAQKQVEKSKMEYLQIQEDLSHEKNGYLYQIGASCKTNIEISELPLKIYQETRSNSPLQEIILRAPEKHLELIAIRLIEKYLVNDDFHFIAYGYPEPQLRFRFSSSRAVELFNVWSQDEEFASYYISLNYYRNEIATYLNQEGVDCYIRASEKLSKQALPVKKISQAFEIHRTLSTGNLAEIFYLLGLSLTLLGKDTLRFSGLKLNHDKAYHDEKVFFDFFMANKNHPFLKKLFLMGELVAKDLHSEIDQWNEILKKSGENRPSKFFELRLIHMELFRIKMIPKASLNNMILRLSARIYRNEIKKS